MIGYDPPLSNRKEVSVMTNTIETGKTLELTLLALGTEYALIGDNGGLIRRACIKHANALKTVNPRKVYIDSKPGDFFGFPVLVSEDVKPDRIAYVQDFKDHVSGLAFRGAFDPIDREWLVSEILDPVTGEPTGRFFFTADEPLLWGN